MEREHRNSIGKNAVALTSDLRIDARFRAILRSQKKLSEEEMEYYAMDNITSKAKSLKFQTDYLKKGPHAFEVLIDALVQTDQNHLARLLDRELTNKYENLNSEDNISHQEQAVPKLSEMALPPQVHTSPQDQTSNSQESKISPASSKQEASISSPISNPTEAPFDQPTIATNETEPTQSAPPLTSITTVPSEETPAFNISSLQSAITVTPSCSLFGNPSDAVDSNTEKPIMDIKVQSISPEKVASLQKLMESGEVYNVKNSPRGKCVIFNNQFFNTKKERLGSKFDEINLTSIAQNLNFNVESFTNRTAEEMKSDLEKLGKEDYSDHDALIIAVMSHGSKGRVSGNDNKPLKIDEEILPLFDGKNCPSLSGKPKMFIFQACQGSEKESGVPEADEDDTDETDAVPSASFATLCLNSESGEPGMSTDASSIPRTADVLKCCATVKNYVSWRTMKEGSWFIRAIASVFAEFAHEEDILSLCGKVNRRVGEQATSENKFVQMPCLEGCTLRKKFYFMPGYHGETSTQNT